MCVIFRHVCITIEDHVLIEPKVNLIKENHPLESNQIIINSLNKVTSFFTNLNLNVTTKR